MSTLTNAELAAKVADLERRLVAVENFPPILASTAEARRIAAIQECGRRRAALVAMPPAERERAIATMPDHELHPLLGDSQASGGGYAFDGIALGAGLEIDGPAWQRLAKLSPRAMWAARVAHSPAVPRVHLRASQPLRTDVFAVSDEDAARFVDTGLDRHHNCTIDRGDRGRPSVSFSLDSGALRCAMTREQFELLVEVLPKFAEFVADGRLTAEPMSDPESRTMSLREGPR